MAARSVKVSGKAKTLLPDYTVSEFDGLNTYIKDLKQLKDGESPASLNWITGRYKDHIELRRGSYILGKTVRTAAGRVTGLGIGLRADGTQVPFFTFGQSILYYNSVTDDAVEINTQDILPSAANGEDVSVMPYQNLAGAFVYFTSPNSSIYKIPTANPGDAVDQQSYQFKGHAKIDTNRMFLWNRLDALKNLYQSVLYLSVSDQTSTAGYSPIVNQAIGSAGANPYSGTLPGIPVPEATVFAVEFAAPISSAVTITEIDQSSNAHIAVSGTNPFQQGDAIYITGVMGMTEINGLIGIVLSVTGNTLTTSINSTGFTAYSSGGNAYQCEYGYDDKNGNLKTNKGGTGTINYATGAYSITFANNPIGPVVAQYFYENSTIGGVADFTIDGNTEGKGKLFNQFDGGGDIVNVFPFDQVQYIFHQLKTWYLSLGTNDTQASNLPYRSQLGMPYLRAGFPTDDGILFLDGSNPAQPRFKALQIDASSASAIVTVVPNSLSDSLDLTPFGYTTAAIGRWGDYDILACEQILNGGIEGSNTILLLRNIYSGQWDMLDYPVACVDQYNGMLVGGSSLSNNLSILFSGYTDSDALINNYWQGKMFNLGVNGLKKFNRFVIKGLIQQTQNIEISFSFDSGSFVKFFTVLGNGPYVNLGNPQLVGSKTVGQEVVGGGETITAYPFEVEFLVNEGAFEYVQPQFAAGNLGYVQIDEFTFKDVRYKARRIPPSRTV